MAVMNPYNYTRPKSMINVNKSPQNALYAARKAQAKDQSTQYLENKILSAKPEELTYMLYEGLVKFIKKAKLGLDNKNFDQVNTFSLRAEAIVDELRSTLNMEIEISKNLDSLYEYVGNAIFEANLEKSEDKFNEALEIAEGFKETWKEAFHLRD